MATAGKVKEPSSVGADAELTQWGCGQKLGLVMPLSPGFHDTQWD